MLDRSFGGVTSALLVMNRRRSTIAYLQGRTTPSALAEHATIFCFVLAVLLGLSPSLDHKSPRLSPRVVTASAVQRVIACRTMTAESLSRMRASARLPCRTPEPETVDLTPRSAEGSPTLTRRHVAASAIRRVIACRISPCVAHRVAVCARAPQGRTPEQKTDGPTDLDRPKRSDDHACRPTWRDRARLRRQTFADHFIVSTISYHLFFASTTSHRHTTTCEPIATRHFARRALPCNHARRPREGRARPYSRFRLVTQSCHSTLAFAHTCTRDAVRASCASTTPSSHSSKHDVTTHTPHKPTSTTH